MVVGLLLLLIRHADEVISTVYTTLFMKDMEIYKEIKKLCELCVMNRNIEHVSSLLIYN